MEMEKSLPEEPWSIHIYIIYLSLFATRNDILNLAVARGQKNYKKEGYCAFTSMETSHICLITSSSKRF
jgi:hypothetical protein